MTRVEWRRAGNLVERVTTEPWADELQGHRRLEGPPKQEGQTNTGWNSRVRARFLRRFIPWLHHAVDQGDAVGFMTLTVGSPWEPNEEAYAMFREWLNKYLRYLRPNVHSAMWVIEWQARQAPHVHIVARKMDDTQLAKPFGASVAAGEWLRMQREDGRTPDMYACGASSTRRTPTRRQLHGAKAPWRRA